MKEQSDGLCLLVDIDPPSSEPASSSTTGPLLSSLVDFPAVSSFNSATGPMPEMSDSISSSMATRYYSSSRALSDDDPFGCDLRALSVKDKSGKQLKDNNPNTGLLVQISDSESSSNSVGKSTSLSMSQYASGTSMSMSQYPSGTSMSVSQYPSITSAGSVSGTSGLFGNLSHISGPGNRLSHTQDSRFSLDIPAIDATTDEVFSSVADSKDGPPDWDRLLNEAQFLAHSIKDDPSKALQTPANKLKKQATRTRLLNFSPGEGLESPLQELRADFLVQNTPEKSPKSDQDLLVDFSMSPKKEPSRKMTFGEQPQKKEQAIVDLLNMQNEFGVQLLDFDSAGVNKDNDKINSTSSTVDGVDIDSKTPQNLLDFSPKNFAEDTSIKSTSSNKSPIKSPALSPTNKTPSTTEGEKKQTKKKLSTIKENVPPSRMTSRVRQLMPKKTQRSPLVANHSNVPKTNNVPSAKTLNDTSAKTLQEPSAKINSNTTGEAVIKVTPAKVKTSNARRTSMTTPQSHKVLPRKPLISPVAKSKIPPSPLAIPLDSSSKLNTTGPQSSRQGPIMKGSLLNRKTGLIAPPKISGITPMSKVKNALLSKVPGITPLSKLPFGKVPGTTPLSKPSFTPNSSNLARATPVRANTSSRKPSLNCSVDASGLVKPGTSSLVKPSSNLSSVGRSRTSLNFTSKPSLNTSSISKPSSDTSISKPSLPRPSLNNSMSRPQGLPRPHTSMPRPQIPRPGSRNSTPAASPRVGGAPLVSSTPAVPRPRPLARVLPSPIGVKRRTVQ